MADLSSPELMTNEGAAEPAVTVEPVGEPVAVTDPLPASPEAPVTVETTTATAEQTETLTQEFKEFLVSIEHNVYLAYEWLRKKL